MNTTSYLDAIVKIGTPGYQSVAELIALVETVSGKVESAPVGSNFLLYSSQLNDGAWAKESVPGLGKAGIRHIGQSEVGLLLNNPIFKTTLRQAVMNEVL